MNTKKIIQVLVIIAILVSSFASTNSVLALYGCASYVTVQWGDTLSGLASYCDTTVDAIRSANPGLGWWLYAGQVLYIPSGSSYYPSYPVSYPSSGGTYTVYWGDTLGIIAANRGTTVNAILAVNPQIWNTSLIFPGQVINIPATSYVPISPVYVPPPPVVITPPIANVQNFSSTLTVIAVKGVNIRDQPNYNGKIVLADDYTKDVTFSYRPDSVTRDDAHQRIWVEVVLSQSGSTYTTGWLPVSGPKDYLNHTGPIEDWVTPHIQ